MIRILIHFVTHLGVTAFVMDALDRRLQTLERQVFGPPGSSRSLSCLPQGCPSAASALTSLARDVGNAAERKERLAPVLRRTQELERWEERAISFSSGVTL